MVESLGFLPAPLLLAIAAVMLAAETGLIIGIVLPGATVPLGLGLLSRLGAVPLTAAVLTAAAATLLGSQRAFLAARRRDPAILRRADPLLTRAAALFRRHPATGIALCRLIGGIRTVTPIVAARAGVPYPRFTAGDVPAALTWSALLVTLGHVAGAAFDEVRLAVGLIGLPFVLACLTVYFGFRAICPKGRYQRRRGRIRPPVKG